jgi:CheY-like chemotaxis protein
MFELQPDGERLELRAGAGWSEDLTGHPTVGTGLASQAGFTLVVGKRVVVESAGAESRFQSGALLDDERVVSGLTVPITGAAQPFGVLGVFARRERKFTEQASLLDFAEDAICVRDAMPSGGTLTFKAEDHMVDAASAALDPAAKPGPHVRLEASGTGIPEGIIDKIFDPFFTTKEVGKGTRLGLSTVLAIVKSHGGFIQVHSEVGKGATFKVFLPATLDTATTTTGAAGSISPLPKGSEELILLVDDEAPLRDTAEQLLENDGYRVLAAADGADALALFSQHCADIRAIVTDVMMPLMDGVGMVRVLRRMDVNVPIVVSTGLDEDDKMPELKRLGVRTFLMKPYNVEKLLTVLRDELNPPS